MDLPLFSLIPPTQPASKLISSQGETVRVLSLLAKFVLIHLFCLFYFIHEFYDEIGAIQVVFRFPCVFTWWITFPGNEEFAGSVSFKVDLDDAINLN